MRRGARSAAFFLLSAACAPLAAIAQNPAQQSVTVVVLDAHQQPALPVKSVRVSLSYLDSSELITDAQQVTNSQGQALLLVSPRVSQRGDLRIGIAGANGLVIFQPADGQLPALPARVNVTMLPMGSPALLGPAQIEAMLHSALLQVSSLKQQNRALKATAAENQKPNLSVAFAAFAQASGFSIDQVDQQVKIWAQNIQLQSAQATLQQKALAEVALNHYANAAQLFHQAADSNHDSIEATEAEEAALEKTLLDKVRDQLHQLIGNSQQSANAFELNLQYHQATQILESAAATADAESRKHPGDKEFYGLWLLAFSAAANARLQEGEVSAASESLPLLVQSASDFSLLARQYSVLGERQASASAEGNRGLALLDQGERVSPDKAAALFNQAVQTEQDSLKVYTRSERPQEWANGQSLLGTAFLEEAQRAREAEAPPLLDQAVRSDRNALEVFTRTEQPTSWALVQHNLATALTIEAEIAPTGKSAVLFDQALQAYNNVLQVFTKSASPYAWATTQESIGVALTDEAANAPSQKASVLFNQAIAAHQRALEIFTQAALPQDWASAQTNLGIVLGLEAERARGEKAAALFDEAVQAYRKSLEVYTRSDLPQNWANTEYNLSIDLVNEGVQAGGDKAAALFDQAIEADRNALQVFTRAETPLDWAEAHAGLAMAYTQQRKYETADAEYRLALDADPDSDFILRRAANFDHDMMFRYDRALDENDRLTQLDPTPANRMNLMEAALTADRFDACLKQAGLLVDTMLTPSLVAIRNTMSLACQWGSGNKSAALAQQKSISAQAGSVQKDTWSFAGTLHYLSTSPAFENGRASWIALFTAVGNSDNAGIAAALDKLRPLIQP